MAKKIQPVNRHEAIEKVEELFQKHIDTQGAILDDYVVGNDGMFTELGEADKNFLKEIQGIIVKDDEEEDEPEVDLQAEAQKEGFALIRISSLADSQKLEAFVNSHIHPIYRDRNQNSYPI